MLRSLTLAAALSFAAVFAPLSRAQEATTISPEAYQLEFENAWVRVTRVHYGPRVSLPPHLHTALASAYVYLNDGGPILFRHHDLPYGGVTRPPTKAGSFRLYRGIDELHSVENPTDVPSHFLRVEFKTEPADLTTLKGKFFRDDPSPASGAERVQFDNAQVRVVRVHVPVGTSATYGPAPSGPALVVALRRTVVVLPRHARGLASGQVAWLEAGQTVDLLARGDAAEVLGFELKTPPAGSR